MTNLDYAMGAGIVFIVFLTIMIGMFDRRYAYSMAGILFFMGVLWGNDICSRDDRIAFFHHHFAQGDEILCRDTNAQLVVISQSNGWEMKEHYGLKGNRGIDLLEDTCEVPHYDKPNCISTRVQIFSAIGAFGWMIIFYIREFKRLSPGQREGKAVRLEKIRQGCEEMAALYRDDPELRELNDFVGDIPQSYTRAELYAYDEFAANIEAVLEKLSSGELEKIGIGYNDTLFAVVLPLRKKGEDHEKL